MGYLVTDGEKLPQLTAQWDNGQYLKEKYNLQHLMMAPPRIDYPFGEKIFLNDVVVFCWFLFL